MTYDTINDAATMRGDDASALGSIDKYELVRELGEGGFGTVYLAHDTVAGVDVAVKGLPPEVKHNESELESIRGNFALVKRLRHPNIVAVTDLHQALSVSYSSKDVESKLRVFERDTMVVMDYAPGVTLAKWRRQFPGGKVPLDKAIAVVRQVASALDYAHGQKVLHRDVKPANVMVESADGGKLVARVLDFGLAAEIRSSMGRLSREIRDTSGTRPYMAPEQWLGKKQGPATDQYALAVMFYELVVGDVPFASVFDCGDPAVMRLAVTTDAPAIPADLPKCVRRALAVALAKKPEDRFASCGEFAAALEGKRVSRRGAETQRWGGAGKVLAFLALAAALGVGWLVYHQNQERRRADLARRESESAVAAAEKAEAERSAEAERQAEEARKAEDARRAEDARQLEEARRKLEEERRAIEEEKARLGKARTSPTGSPEEEDDASKASLAEQEARRKEVAALAETKVDILIRAESISETMSRIAAYRSEPDGFAAHIANADAQRKIADGVGRSPATSAEAKAALKTLEDAERVIQREYNWLKTNKSARDEAKQIEAEIVRGIVPELERFKAGEYAPVTFGNGDRLRKDGNAALANGDFPEARAKLEDAKKRLADAVAEAKRFCVDTHLKTAKTWGAAAKWQQCVEECDTILGWDAANPEAKKLKAEAESHLVPTAKVVVKVNGTELKDGETVRIGPTEWKTPIVWGAKNIKEGKTYGGEVVYEKDGKTYVGRLENFKVDRHGNRNFEVALKRAASLNGDKKSNEESRHKGVQLWEGGPYWADRNIGAENPWDYGYYFWWGGTVGYKRVGKAWVASDGSSSDFSFRGSSIFSKLFGRKANIPTSGKNLADLRNEGWITQTGALAPTHDAAHVHWGGNWRMPTKQELSDLNNNCDWIWTTKNGVNGYEVRGRSDYASNSIFFPCAGYVNWPSIRYAGSYGCYWSSVPGSSDYNAWGFDLTSSDRSTDYDYRSNGQSVRPVRGFAE